MNGSIRMVRALIAVLALAAAAPAAAQQGALPPELEATLSDYIAAWNSGDESAIVAFHAPDAVVYTGAARLMGQDILEGWIRPTFAVAGGGLDATIEVAFILGDAAVHQGRYSFRLADQPGVGSGVYSALWQRQQDGSWKLRSMLVHADPPAS